MLYLSKIIILIGIGNKTGTAKLLQSLHSRVKLVAKLLVISPVAAWTQCPRGRDGSGNGGSRHRSDGSST